LFVSSAKTVSRWVGGVSRWAGGVSRWAGGETEPRLRELRRIQERFGDVGLR
jgi:hypothetical protein